MGEEVEAGSAEEEAGGSSESKREVRESNFGSVRGGDRSR